MKISFITLTNNGYKEMTKNCIISLKKIGINYLKVYCIDQESYDYLSKDFNNIIKMDLQEENIESSLINFRKKNWSKIVYKKFDIIYKELLNHDLVFFTDGDIVYKKSGFIEYCLQNLKDNDLIAQDDKISDTPLNGKPIHLEKIICSGFMLIKNNKTTLNIFNPENIPKMEIECDQYYLNKVRDKFKYRLLPMNLFPNGSYFRLKKPNDNYLTHFNYILGHKKIEKMKKYGNWYL